MLIKVRGNKSTPFLLLHAGIVVLTLFLFIVDLLTPLGITSGVGYILVTFLGYWLAKNRYIFLLAAICCILVIAGYFFSPGSIAPAWSVLANRILSIILIIISAGFTARFRSLTINHKLNEKMLNATLTCATEAIIVVNEHGEIVFINKSAKDIFGYAEYELLGKKIEILVPQAIRGKHIKYREQYMLHPKARPMGSGLDLKAVRKDGTSFPVEISLSHFKLNNQLFVTSFVTDISRRKLAEEELKHSNSELEESNKMLKLVNADLEQFVDATSHELQEPLRMISNYTKLIEIHCDNKHDGDTRKYAKYVTDEAKRMKQLIVSVQQYINISKKEEKTQSIDCNLLLKSAIKELHEEIQKTGALIKIPAPLPFINGRKEQLLHLFEVLIDNSIKFKSEKPPEITISVIEHDKEWQFQVQDNGISIDPQYHDKLFKIFKKLHTNQDYKGPGIGLAIAKKVVDYHGGKIWFESEPEKGTTFKFTIRK